MGLDGLSMSNLGLHRNLTSAQLANEADATARQALENQLPDVDGVGKKEKAGKKDPDAAFAGMVPFIADEKDSQENEEEQSEEANAEPTEIPLVDGTDDDSEEPRYLFKMGADNLIEVFDTKTKTIVKKLSPEEAANSVHNFTKMPGLFIDKEV